MIERYQVDYGWGHQRGWTVVTPVTLLGTIGGERAVRAVERWWSALPISETPSETPSEADWRYDGGSTIRLTREHNASAVVAIRSSGEDAFDSVAWYADVVADLVQDAADPEAALTWTPVPVEVPPCPPQARAALAPTGTLRAVINLGNPVLAQGDADEPGGVSVELARLLAAYLDVPVEFTCVTAARDSVAAVESGAVDVGFVAIDPDRGQTLSFTDPYVVIEGVFVVPEGSGLTRTEDVDAPGVRVGVKRGSAYDLQLSRELTSASIVRGDEGVDVYLAEGLEAGAGIRGPVAEFVDRHPGQRLLEPAFMQIRQAMAVSRNRDPAAVDYLRGFVQEACRTGFVLEMLARSGQDPQLAAR